MTSDERLRQLIERYKNVPDFMYIEIDKINTKSRFGDELIHMASVNGNTADVEYLLSLGVDVNVRGEDDFTPLHYAVQQGNTSVVELLLGHGADIYAEDSSGCTPEELAVDLGELSIEKLLVEERERRMKSGV